MILRRRQGALPGFGQIRLILVVAIVSLQSIEVSDMYGSVLNSALWIVPASLIPMLFALTGFWFAQESSAVSWPKFAGHRARRILPVLLLSVLLAALALGPIFTTAPLSAYFSDAEFGGYFLNLMGWPQLRLPGVFEFNNAAGIVNGPYWALPYILGACVIGMALAALRVRALVLASLAILLIFAALMVRFGLLNDMLLPSAILQMLGGRGLVTLLCFLFGALGYVLRDRLPLDWRLLVVSAVAIGAIALRANRYSLDDPIVDFALAIALSYATIFLAAARIDILRVSHFGQNYWLGLFFYSFPIQQAWMALGSNDQNWAVNLLLSIPVALLISALSWHYVEMRVLAPDQRAGWPEAPDGRDSRPARRPGVRGLMPVLRSPAWYRTRLSEILPGVALAILLFAAAAGIMAMTMFALQRDTPGM